MDSICLVDRWWTSSCWINVVIGKAGATAVGGDVVVGVITMSIEIIAMAAVLVLFVIVVSLLQEVKLELNNQRQ